MQKALTIKKIPSRDQECSRRILREGITHLDRFYQHELEDTTPGPVEGI